MFATVVVISSGLIATAVPAGTTTSGPFTPSTVSTTTEVSTICRAYGGSLSANSEADQKLKYTVTAPNAVTEGQTFTIKVRQPPALFPRTDSSTGIEATIVHVYNQITKFQVPQGLTINSVSLGPIDGNVEANPDAGYYVNKANVPHGNVSGVGDVPNENFDPMTLPASQRLAIPATAPAAYFNAATNVVRMGLLGTDGNSGEYASGAALQAPSLFINVTATAAAGTNLQLTLAGQLPGAEPRNYTGSQPGNFPAPTNITVNRADSTSSDTTWTDPSYVNYVYTTALGGLVTVTAKAACGPGWESRTGDTTPPAYMTGDNAVPNGQSPPLSSTRIIGIGATAPFEGAKYVTGQAVNASYTCQANPTESYDTCTGGLPNGASVDTSTPGDYTFTIDATDGFEAPLQRVVHYSVVDNSPPVANAGAPQTGKTAGSVVTLDASGSTDPDGPPAQTLSYSWAQVDNGAPTVTLTGANTAKPTFTVPAATTPGGTTYEFAVTADDGFGGTNAASTTVASVPSTPTVAVSKTRPPGGSTFYVGDTVTLNAAITNPDGTTPSDYTYLWTQTGGRTTALSSNTAQNPTYVIPPSGVAPGTSATCTSGAGAVSATSANCPTYNVVVTKTNTGKSSTAAVLANYGATVATRPVANAGAAQVRGTARLVQLDGSASTQAQSHAITYQWSQTGGETVTLSDPTAQKPTFTTPATQQTLTFSLIVTDPANGIIGNGTGGKVSTAATTTVTVGEDHVVANSGPDQTGKVAGNTITLDASGSTDPDGLPLTYQWTQTSGPTVTLSSATVQKPTFTAPAATTPTGYTVQFAVTATNGNGGPADTDTDLTPVTITVGASTPTATVAKARAGGGSTFYVGDTITLTANITNPDGNAGADYTYVWTQTGGRTTALSSNTAQNPTYVIPPSGVAPGNAAVCTSGAGAVSPTSANCPTFNVVVTKVNTAKSSTAAVLSNYSSTLPTRPTANAGTAQSVKVGTGVTLSGSGTQAQGHPVTYAWTQTAGPAVTLSSSTVASPTFTAGSTPTSYTFSLVATDTNSGIASGASIRDSLASTVTITVTDYAAPVADAGSDKSPKQGAPVSLSAAGSSQADGHTLSYSWTQVEGTAVTLSGANTATPSFTAPITTETLTFRVTVTDTQNPNPAAASSTDDVNVTAVPYATPVADAGADQTPAQGDPVSLTAAGSTQADAHTLSYSWTQLTGPAVTLSGANTATPSFTAPLAVGPLTFRVAVTDTENPNPAAASSTDDVTITVLQYAIPVANAGPNRTNVDNSTLVTLDGSASSQVNGHALTYQWTQTGGPAVTLVGPTTAKPKFTTPIGPVTLTFRLVVNDGFNDSLPATVTIGVAGIRGLDLTTTMTGEVAGEDNFSTFAITVKNTGTLTRTVSSNDVAITVTRNSVAVSPAQYTLTAKSASVKPGGSVGLQLKWTHNATLHAGDAIVVKACDNQVGDEHPENNCGQVTSPAGLIKVSAQVLAALKIPASSVSTAVPVRIVNQGTIKVRPIRTNENVTVTVRVNGGSPISVAPPVQDARVVNPGDDIGSTFTWAHAKLAKGTSVAITSCAVIPGNWSLNPCTTKTVIVT